jgi:peptidoglycan hydrolase CwlO-like protein
MSSDPPELGKGLFGYRKSAVNQIIADRDIMLRQAEGRVRAAESKVADLESELVSMRERNTRMDEQLERLRQHLDALAARGEAFPVPQDEALPVPQDEEEEVPVQREVTGWEEEPVASAVPSEEAPSAEVPPVESRYPSYAEDADESAQDEEAWPGADHEWPVAEEAVPVVEADTGDQSAGVVEEDDLPYGAEVRLKEGAAVESPAAAWMQTGETTAEDEQEQDEVALASGGYGFEDYDADEQQGYGDFESAEERAEESPSPFAQFPFTSEAFDQPGALAASADEEDYADEPAPQFHSLEPEVPQQEISQPEVPQPEVPQPEVPQPEVAQPEPRRQFAVPVEPAAAAHAPAVSSETADITNRFLTEELTGILVAAEESAARIVERARATTQRQIARSNRVWREVQAEVSRFSSWRQEVEPIIRTVQSKVDGVRSEIEEVPERIRQALAPMADSISSIDADLAELAAASTPPLLLTPGGLESDGSDDAWGLDDYDDGFDHGEERSEGDVGEAIRSASDESFGESFRGEPGGQDSGHLHAG